MLAKFLFQYTVLGLEQIKKKKLNLTLKVHAKRFI